MEKSIENDTNLRKNINIDYGLNSSRFKGNNMSDRAYEITYKAKKKHRTDIRPKEWSKFNFYYSDYCKKTLLNPPNSTCKVAIEEYDSLSQEEFCEKYEKALIPVLIRNSTNEWKAKYCWNFQVLYT